MSTSGPTFKELAIPHFKEVFDIIDAVLGKRGLPYYLIGANALAIKFLVEGKKPPRGTADIDFAIMISTQNEYDSIVHELVERGFRNVDEPYRFYYSDENVVVDVLPFGTLEQKNTENFMERDTFLYAYGLQYVLEDSEPTTIDNKMVGIPPLPGMIVLKLVAYSDHWEWRQKDLTDILTVIEHYYELAEDEILETHYDTFLEAEEFDRLKIAARVLGRKAGKWLKVSEPLNARVLRLLDDNLVIGKKSPIAEDWAQKRDWEITYAQSIIKELRTGLTE